MDSQEKILEILNTIQTDINGLKDTQAVLINEISAIHKQTEDIFTNTDSESGLYQPALS